MFRILQLVPKFDAENERGYQQARCKQLSQFSLPVAFVYAIPILGFYFWDRLIDSSIGYSTLLTRFICVAIMLGCGMLAKNCTDPTRLRAMVMGILLAGGIGISVTLALVKGGFSYGLGALLIFMTCSSYLSFGLRHALTAYVPISLICGTLMVVSSSVSSTLMINNGLFLAMALSASLASSYFFDQISRYRYQLGEHLKNVAQRDPLTKLSNRRAVYEKTTELISNTRTSHRPLSVLMVDIDHFKAINDKYGHDGGDDILREVALSISKASRDTDMVARWGGEEFLIILPNTLANDAKAFAERLCLRLRRNAIKTRDGKLVQITVSIGISSRDGLDPDDKRPLSTMIGEADKALYYCKNNGRDQCQVFGAIPSGLMEQEAMRKHVTRRNDIAVETVQPPVL